MSVDKPSRPPAREVPALIAMLDRHLPYWGPQFSVLAAILLDLSLPQKLEPLHPHWLLPVLEGILVAGLIMASPNPRLRHSPLRRRVALTLTAIVSATNIVSLSLLAHFLLHGASENGRDLIYAGAVLWITNVLLFGIWYWELDRGGPLARRVGNTTTPDFMFPQMTDTEWAPEGWHAGFIDYLYVSFTNATAFSPTDTMPLTPLAKVLMGTQALAALITVGLVVARAVNILQG